MFGYIIPDKPNMYMKDYYRYRAFYCGLCKCIGHECSEMMRFTTNYDMTFISLLAHGVLGVEPEFSNEGCILNPMKKKTIAKSTDLMRKIADVNTLLIYYKIIDDVRDGGGKAAFSKVFINKHFKRAKARMPQLDEIFKREYDALWQLEKDGCGVMDMLADPFANMMREAIKAILGDEYTVPIGGLIYNIARFVYIMDAVDDVGDDHSKSEFNPYLIGYKYTDRVTFNADKGKDVEFLLMHCYTRIKESFAEITLKTNEGVVTNILWYGILARINVILNATSKLPKVKV